MKSLLEFKSIVEEEKSDYTKFDALGRAGLANKAQMQRLHKILDRMSEENPKFSSADRAIIQNMFVKMVDLLTNNKQIFQQSRRAVSEAADSVSASDFKLDSSGRKIKAHKVKVSADDVLDGKLAEDIELTEEKLRNEPPFVLLLKRKAIRLYPDNTRIALYFNDRLNKFFSVPYSVDKETFTSPFQAEEVELEESVMNHLHKIASGEHPTNRVKFASGETRKVDKYTASAISQVHKAVNDENKKKLSDMVHKSPAHLMKVAEFAFSRAK